MNRLAQEKREEIPQARRSVYMDSNATKNLLPEVFEAMTPYLLGECGNASSGHRHGRQARAAVETARQQLAYLLHSSNAEVVFTSGGAKADNRAIFGTMTKPGGHIITSSIEHHAVLRATQVLEKKRMPSDVLRVDASGRVDPGDVRRPLRPNTRLIGRTQIFSRSGD